MRVRLLAPLVVLLAASLMAGPASAASAPGTDLGANVSAKPLIKTLEFFKACRGCGHPNGGTFRAKWARATGILTIKNNGNRTKWVDCTVAYWQEHTAPYWIPGMSRNLVGKDWVSASVKPGTSKVRDWWILGGDETGQGGNKTIIDVNCTTS